MVYLAQQLWKFRAYSGPVAAIMILALAFGAAPPATAHGAVKAGNEDGQDKYLVAVGWQLEPAYAGVLNGVVLFISRIEDGWPISTQRGDIVDVHLEARYLSGEGDVLDAQPLDRQPVLMRDTDNQYVTWFVPELPGTYAFHLTGTIDDRSDGLAGPVTLDAVLVCGEDSPGKHDAFSCVVAPQRFPELGAVVRSLGHGHHHGVADEHGDDEDGHHHAEDEHGEDGHSHGESDHGHHHDEDGHSHREQSAPGV